MVGVDFRGAYTAPCGAMVAIAFKPPGTAPTVSDRDYAAWKNTALHVAAPGVLTGAHDVDGQDLTAHVATGPSHGTLSLSPDGGFTYTPTSGFVGVDAFSFVARNEDGIDSAPGVVTITVALLPTTRYTHTAADMPWARTPSLARACAVVFARAAQCEAHPALAWGGADPIGAALWVSLQRAERVRRSTALAFALATRLDAGSTTLAFSRPPQRQHGAVLPWSRPPARRTQALVPYTHPPTQRHAAALPWSRPPARRAQALVPYTHPPTKARRWWVPWRKCPPIAWHIRTGHVDEPPEPAGPPRYQPPCGAMVGLAFVCPQVDLPGAMIPLRFGAAACYAAHKRPRTYIVINTTTVRAIGTGQAIEVTNVDVSCGLDDMHRAFSIDLADPADLQWLTPQAGVPIEIEIKINGWTWTGIVEEWTRSQQWPGTTVRVSGRSTTALLDEPYAPRRAYIESELRSAAQLVDHELDATGFTADYDTVDWTVPADTWHYDSATPASAVRAVAEASGATARAHPWKHEVVIRPRWPVSPWEWATTAADKSVLDDYVPSLSAQNATSRATVHELQIPLWPSSAGDKPGLIEPGDLVEFLALAGWKAMATTVRISATVERSSNGAGTLVVWQTVTLEAPPAAPRFDYVLVSGEQVGVADPIIRDGTAGTSRLPMITDKLITAHEVALERGRNALAGGGDGTAGDNLWRQLTGLIPSGRYIKGNVTAINGDGSVTVATSDGSTIRARPLPEQSWSITDGVFVQDGRIVDSAPSLAGVTQYV